jgi:predicted dehydrogenase
LNRIVKEIQDGLIGNAYAGKAWYSNTRGGIGSGKSTYVPDWLDWDLWQGPAPRQEYTDNVVHYNWHWFYKWGTGELLNNGTHEIDMCRWALGVDYPTQVTSHGGRYHFDDDWEWYDTQLAGFEYDGKKSIHWDGRSCNGIPLWERGRGSMIYGSEGSVLMDRQGYWVYDLRGKEIRKEMEAGDSVSMGVTGGGSLDDLHIANFISGLNAGAQLNAPIDDASISVTTCHLGNMAQRTGQALHIDPATGKPAEAAAMELWSRDYEPGWEPQV